MVRTKADAGSSSGGRKVPRVMIYQQSKPHDMFIFKEIWQPFLTATKYGNKHVLTDYSDHIPWHLIRVPAVGGGAPRKTLGGAGPSSSGAASPSSNKYGGGNPVCPRPTPDWQKGIAMFMSPGKSKQNKENDAPSEGASKETEEGSSKDD